MSFPEPAREKLPSRAGIGIAVGCLVLLGLWLSQPALGQAITEFSVKGPAVDCAPQDIVAGPDGSLWFSEYPGLGRITTSGNVTHIPTSAPAFNGGYRDLVFDRDGNLWFTANLKIARLGTDGQIVEFTLPSSLGTADRIALGPDSNIWFTLQYSRRIGRITPSGSISTFALSFIPYAITAGPDGNVWFTEGNNQIGRIIPSGSITEFSVPGTGERQVVFRITAGADGALWFTDLSGKIGRITTAGEVSEFPIPGFEGDYRRMWGITAGPDGNIWFTEDETGYLATPWLFPSKVGRVTPEGAITTISLPTLRSIPQGITTGPDGNLWVVETAVNKVARLSPSATITCSSDSETLCLDSGRFRVSTTWFSISPPAGSPPRIITSSSLATAAPLTNSTGAFWFFSPDNLDLVVKVLDGRSINGRFWVFYGSLTNVEFTLAVTDTQTGAVKTYLNPQGQLASVADTAAF